MKLTLKERSEEVIDVVVTEAAAPTKVFLNKKKGFYFHKSGSYLRQTLSKINEKKYIGQYRYKKIKDGRMLLIGILKSKYRKKDGPSTVALAILRSDKIDGRELGGDAQKMMTDMKDKKNKMNLKLKGKS